MDHSTEHSHDSDGSHDHPVDLRKNIRTYLKVGATLIAFTFITVFVAYKVDLGDEHLNIALGLLIAAFKVSLVGLIFMHLNHERGLIYKTLLFAMIFFAAMMFLFCLAFYHPIHDSFLKP